MSTATVLPEARLAYRQTATVCVAMLMSLLPLTAVMLILLNGAGIRVPSDGGVPWRWIFYGLAVLQILLSYVLRAITNRPLHTIELAPRLQRLRSRALLTSALAEGVAIYGLMLALITGMVADFFVLAVVSLAMHLGYFPRWSEWERWLAHRQELGGFGDLSNTPPSIVE